MKKYLFSLFCITISLILLLGCDSDRSAEATDWEPTIYKTVNNLDGVTMIVKEETVSTTGLTVRFENNADKQCVYGEPFWLEKKIKGNWYLLPIVTKDNYGFDDIGYDLDSSTFKEWTVDWDWLYGKLDTGEYRIVKNILDFRKPGDYDEYHLAAGFTIE